MRFRFCGDLDCPDWVLGEITTLSKLTSIKMKVFCQQVIKDIISDTIDYEKIFKTTADAKYEPNDVRATTAALTFILSSAATHSVNEDSLGDELLQLGLPKENATALCKVYSVSYTELQAALKGKTLRLPYLDEVSWRVDYILSSSHLEEVKEPMINMCLKVADPATGGSSTRSFTLTADKFRVLYTEMKQAQQLMEDISEQPRNG